MLKLYGRLLQRELLLACRSWSEVINPLAFYCIVVSLFPLAIGPEAKVLQNIAPGLIWVAALLAMLLSLDRLFTQDFADGTLEQVLLSPHPKPVLVMITVIAHWLLTGVPLLLLTPLLALQFQLPLHALGVLLLSLLLCTPVLSCLGAILKALTVGLRSGGVLLALLLLPLAIPVLVFGASSVTLAMHNEAAVGLLAIQAAFCVLMCTLAPFAIATSVKISVSYQ